MNERDTKMDKKCSEKKGRNSGIGEFELAKRGIFLGGRL
jgi:hypothetical protein